MATGKNYSGCRVTIHYGISAVTQTKILHFDAATMSVTVGGLSGFGKTDQLVSLLISTDDGVHEYCGRAHRSGIDPTQTEISLFGGREKEESRVAKRYPINMQASVQNLIFDAIAMPLLHPLVVSILNLSSSGVLIKAGAFSFAENAVIHMLFNIDGQPTDIYGRIVRVKEIDSNTAEYGCKLMGAQESSQ